MEFRASKTGKSTPAPEKDRIKGSDKNADGSAKNASGRISVSPGVRVALKNKVRDHNESVRGADKPSWSLTTIRQLLAVYRRGAGAFSTSHRPGIGRAAWAMARVNAYLYLLRSGRPKNPKYVTDNDLLPSEHPRASSRRSYELEIEERSINLRPPAGMAAAARRGLELHEEGRSGDGLKPETVSRAKRIAAREVLTEAHVREMRAWFRRHKVDRRPGWGDRGKETPGYTAWMLWGGDPGWTWSEVKVSRLEREGGAEQRGRMGAPRAPKRNKKAKARPGRPAKVGPSAGCGTGSGGFKTGNNCAKEDGIPRKPFSMGGALKQGPKGELQAAKAAIAAKQAKVAAKQQKQQAKDQLTSKKAKALVRKKQKDAKEAESQKQADAAAAAKKKAMLQKIRVKKANEKIAVAATPKSIAEQIKEAKVAKANEGVKVVETPKTIAQEIAEAKAAAAAKTAATGKPAPYRMPAGAKDAVEPPQPTPTPSSLEIKKDLGGSTGAQLAVDPATGKQYVLKGGKSAAHIENESQADDLYRAAGVNVPQQQIHPSPEGPKKVAEFIKGKTLQELKDTNTKQYEAAVEKVKKHFVADALLANYDVVGGRLDNIVVGKGGKVFRVDNGGSLTFRAQGKTKDFGPDVTELNSLRSPSTNPAAASVFGTLTDKQISGQIGAILKKKDAILAAAQAPGLKSALEARMKFLEKWQNNYKQQKNLSKTPSNASPGIGAGLQNPNSVADEVSLHADRKRLFGASNEAAWNSWHPDHYKSSASQLKIDAKQTVSKRISQRMEKLGVTEADVTDDLLDAFGGWNSAYSSQKIPVDLPTQYERRYKLSVLMVDAWAGASGKGSPKSIGIQRAIEDEFGIKGAAYRHFSNEEKLHKQRVETIRRSKAVRAMIRAQYEETQDQLAKLGISKLTVVRGYSSTSKVDPTGSEQGVRLQPASSFSLDRGIANAFSGDALQKRLATATIPAKRVLSTCLTGFGCMNEQEITILGGTVKAKVRKLNFSLYTGPKIFTPQPGANP
jgi:hypothetical protein